MMKRSAFGLGALLAIIGCGSRPKLEDPPPSFGRGPDTIERFCPEPADEIRDVVTETLQRNGFEIEFDDHDRLGGDLIAAQPGARVLVRVRQVDANRSSLAVRVDPPDAKVTLAFQEAFARALGRGEARTGLFGGVTERETLRMPLDAAIETAEETFRALRIGVLDRRRGRDEAVLDGRRSDSIPVRIRLRSPDGKKTDATFVAGASKSEDARALARRMRLEFMMRGETRR
jgi:hypothetical protein